MRRLIRLALPAALAAICLGFLSGCLMIPTFNATVEGKNLSDKIGDASGKQAIRVGSATLNDVYRAFGPPQYSSEDGLSVGYTWKLLRGYWIGLCFGPQTTREALILHFDNTGVLKSFKVQITGTHTPGGWGGTDALPIQLEGMALQLDGLGAVKLPSTPASRPSFEGAAPSSPPLPVDGVPYSTQP